MAVPALDQDRRRVIRRTPGCPAYGRATGAFRREKLMRTVPLNGLTVSAEGLGCWGMSEVYGPTDWEQSIATIHSALDLSITFLDTADAYGAGHNEVLLAAPGALAGGVVGARY